MTIAGNSVPAIIIQSEQLDSVHSKILAYMVND